MALLPIRTPRLSLGIGADRLWLETAPRPWAVRLTRGEVVRQERPIPPGLVRPSATAPNISDIGLLAGEIHALQGHQPIRWWARPVALSLPDSSARVALLDFAAWPDKAAEAEALLRWRLQTDLRLSAADTIVVHRVFIQEEILPQQAPPRADRPVNVLVIAIRRPVLEQYELACAQAGLLPVTISLNSLRFFDLSRPTMQGEGVSPEGSWFFFHTADDSLSFIAGRGARPVFLRIKPLRSGVGHDQASLTSEMLATLQFFDDRFVARTSNSTDSAEGLRPFFLGSHLAPIQEGLAEAFTSLRTRIIPLPVRPEPTRRRWWRTSADRALPYLNLVLSTQRLTAAQATQWSLVLLIGAAIACAAWAWQHTEGLAEQAAQYERVAERMQDMNRRFAGQAQKAGITLSEERAKALGREVAFANRLVEQQAFSWTTFLSHLEETVPPQVSISSVSLNFKDAGITLSGLARSLKDVTAFANEVERHPAFQNVVLANHRVRDTAPESGGAQTQALPAGMLVPQRTVITDELRRTVEFTMTVTYHPTP